MKEYMAPICRLVADSIEAQNMLVEAVGHNFQLQDVHKVLTLIRNFSEDLEACDRALLAIDIVLGD